MKRFLLLAGLGLLAVLAGPVLAAAITLPDSGQTTTLTATVSEQAQVTVPAGVAFAVTDVTQSTDSDAQSVSVSSIVLETATKQLKISLKANAVDFTPPVALATTWAAADVSWNDGTWTNATGNSNTLSEGSFIEVATAAADAASASVADLVFTLAAKSTVKRSGDHTLVVTWKFESIGT
ncbi:MAG: hypothetical protein ACYC7E_05660 [Armatimonadota bacterium]